MADATAPAATGTSSTPPASPASDAVAPVAAAPTTDATPTTPAPDAATPSVSSPADPAAPQDAAPTADPAPQALFTLPEDVKLAPEATSKFETFLKGKLGADGKVTLTSQEVVDQFLEQARDANARWQQQIQDTDKANEAACKSRFTPAQLSAAETALGFAASFDPTFRDFAKRQLNDPTFVNFMRIVGERLTEDTFEVAGTPPPSAQPRSRAERMGYAKPKPN